jgi:hypothetical protein
VNAKDGRTADESIIDGSAGATVVMITSSNVTIDGFEITSQDWGTEGPTSGVRIEGAAADISTIVIKNNIIHKISTGTLMDDDPDGFPGGTEGSDDDGVHGIYIGKYTNTITIENNEIKDLSQSQSYHGTTPAGILVGGTADAIRAQNVTIRNNSIFELDTIPTASTDGSEAYARAIDLQKYITNITIDNNKITKIGASTGLGRGVSIAAGGLNSNDTVISNSTFDDISESCVHLDVGATISSTTFDSCAKGVYQFGSLGGITTISDSSFSNCTTVGIEKAGGGGNRTNATNSVTFNANIQDISGDVDL